jgi:hypothetical protein
MLVGHYAAGFLAKRAAPRMPLAALMLAAMFPDFLTFILQLAGVEHARLTPPFPRYFPLDAYDNPITHSLAMNLVWAGTAAVVYLAWRRDRRGAIVLAMAVSSHWVFDFITHRPDMLLVPGVDLRVGLTLWDSITGTFLVEGGLWVLAITTYARATRATAALGSYCLWVLVVSMTAWFVVTPFAPPPAGEIGVIANAVLLTIHLVAVLLAYGTDRHRVERGLHTRRLAHDGLAGTSGGGPRASE